LLPLSTAVATSTRLRLNLGEFVCVFICSFLLCYNAIVYLRSRPLKLISVVVISLGLFRFLALALVLV